VLVEDVPGAVLSAPEAAVSVSAILDAATLAASIVFVTDLVTTGLNIRRFISYHSHGRNFYTT